ncbi:hypothetical protein AC249_AIPGENE28997 [Exaiptasia diaphana]|nr:hypothetical protein AC249_AIPGENE28997 [Exaiptasia diaphana]
MGDQEPVSPEEGAVVRQAVAENVQEPPAQVAQVPPQAQEQNADDAEVCLVVKMSAPPRDGLALEVSRYLDGTCALEERKALAHFVGQRCFWIWMGVELRDYWDTTERSLHISTRETLPLVNVLKPTPESIRDCRVDDLTDSQVLSKTWSREGSRSQDLTEVSRRNEQLEQEIVQPPCTISYTPHSSREYLN